MSFPKNKGSVIFLSKKEIESAALKIEEAEFTRSLNSLFELQRNCSSRRLRSQIREQLFSICINNLDCMSLDTIVELRATATVAKHRERIDHKIIKSRKIVNLITSELDKCTNFTTRTELYNKCAQLAGGYFLVLIAKHLFETLDINELDSSQAVVFFSNFTTDTRINNLSWETSYIYSELLQRINVDPQVANLDTK